MEKSIAVIILMLFLSACSAVRIQYGEATVTSFRLFSDQNLEGLKINAPDGTSVVLNKKSDEVQTEALSAIVGAAVKAAVPIPVK